MKNNKIVRNLLKKVKIIKIITFLTMVGLFALITSCAETTQTKNITKETNETLTITEETLTITENLTANINASTVKEMHIDMFNWNFTQEQIILKKGDHVKLIVTSSAGNHGIAIPTLGLSTKKILEGGQEIIEFDAAQTGTFDYYCNIPCGKGHKAMRSKIVVEE